MKKRKNPTETRHGKLAEGRTQTSLTIEKDLLDKAKAAAQADGRSLSNWLEQLVKKTICILEPLALAAGFLLFWGALIWAGLRWVDDGAPRPIAPRPIARELSR